VRLGGHAALSEICASWSRYGSELADGTKVDWKWVSGNGRGMRCALGCCAVVPPFRIVLGGVVGSVCVPDVLE
jgi:hypothetical protein